jgi:hypothetical protein
MAVALFASKAAGGPAVFRVITETRIRSCRWKLLFQKLGDLFHHRGAANTAGYFDPAMEIFLQIQGQTLGDDRLRRLRYDLFGGRRVAGNPFIGVGRARFIRNLSGLFCHKT